MESKSISSHVLDLSLGQPGKNIEIKLYRQSNTYGEFVLIKSGLTNSDGRVSDMAGGPLGNQPGLYKMYFDTEKYFKDNGIECFYPFVEIVFHVKNVQDKYHIPLLLSPFGYSTYRGS